MISESNPQQKEHLVRCGIINHILDLITDFHHGSDLPPSKAFLSHIKLQPVTRGTGYGSGSTRSQWDIERYVEGIMLREEQTIWLLNAFNSFLYCDAHDNHLTSDLVALITSSSLVPMIRCHLKNESIFDVSEHLEFYRSLLETVCCMAMYRSLADLIYLPSMDGPSIALCLLPRFRSLIVTYLNFLHNRFCSSDLRLVDFLHKVDTCCNLLYKIDCRARAAHRKLDYTPVMASAHQSQKTLDLSSPNPVETLDYVTTLKSFQITSWKFVANSGNFIYPYTFRKEAKTLNLFSPTLKVRIDLNKAFNRAYVIYEEVTSFID
ncbi:unnamed protein product [Soboliphyme baturini]|uniref:FPL domain-containing protein n=1 Tax=Soboliphyme baturini TaxID=241478 RepID=A0A183IJQ9_9BILA|nr:unnamed protein product [Soboliphyme baturini]